MPDTTGGTPGPEVPRQGGLYKLLPTDGKQRHHMPAATILRELDYDKDTIACIPAIRMDPEDHFQTPSHGRDNSTRPDGHGGRVSVKEHRDKLKQLVRDGRFRDAIQLDIDSIKAQFPGKYDEAIEQMLREYERIKDALEFPGSGVGGAGCDPLPPGGGGRPRPDPEPAPAAPTISPAYQEFNAPSAQASWTVTVAQNPDHDQTLVVDYGDNSTGVAYIPEGTGNTAVAFLHQYEISDRDFYSSTGAQHHVTASTAPVVANNGVVVIPQGQPALATVHQC